MAKQPTKQQAHSWAVYHIKGTPAKLVGILEAPDEQTAIARVLPPWAALVLRMHGLSVTSAAC
jgi:hypothetical protein